MNLKEHLQKIIDVTLSTRDSLNLEITSTQACNCRCKYCFESGHLLDSRSCIRNIEEENRQLQLITNLCQRFDVTKYSKLTITFWGGEPMMNPEFIYSIINTTLEYDFIDYYMFTNGTLLDKFKDLFSRFSERKLRMLKRKIYFQLSYDGEPHNKTKRGKLSSDLVLKTARFLKDSGFQISFKPTLSLDMVGHLVEIWKSYKSLFDEFGECARYSPTLDMTCSDIQDEFIASWRSQLVEVAKMEISFIKEHGYSLMKHFDPDSRKACDVSKTVMMHNDGNFYLCHGCIYLKSKSKFILGNTKSVNSLLDIYEKMNGIVNLEVQNGDCKKCPATYCTVCHANYVDPDNIREDWIACMSKDQRKCQCMKVFGLVSHALNLAAEINTRK